MQTSDVVELMVPALSVLLVLGILSVVAGLVLGVLVLTRGRAPSLLTGLSTGALATGVAAVGWWSHAPVEGAALAGVASVIAAGVGGVLVVLLPALFHLILVALAGARTGPRAL